MTYKEKAKKIEILEKQLGPDGQLNRKIYNAVLAIQKAGTSIDLDKDMMLYGKLDHALNAYLNKAIEYDRLVRSKKISHH